MTNPRALATIQTYLGKNKWGEKRLLAQADGRDCIKIPLSRGGDLCIYPDMIPLEVAKGLTQDILGKPEVFRHYLIQGINKEPRVHAQFHQDATADFNQRQPGYRYNQSITAKARPLSTFARLETLYELAKKAGGVKQWNIGATVVVYRDGNDKMGQHAGTIFQLAIGHNGTWGTFQYQLKRLCFLSRRRSRRGTHSSRCD